MPIRFTCIHCHQALAIATRKAGTQVKCPKCQTDLVVPAANHCNVGTPATLSPPAAKKTLFEGTQSSTDNANVDQPELPTFSSLDLNLAPASTAPPQIPEFNFEADRISVPPAPAIPNTAAATAKPGDAATTAIVVDRNLVAISRTVLYAQAILIIVVGVAAFWIGYLSGRGMRQPTAEELAASQTPVEVIGEVLFRNDEGADVPDAGAVVIAVPQQIAVGEKFSIEGLRPDDPPPQDGGIAPAILALESEGGGLSRADVGGQFRLSLRPGNYWLLAISANASRPANVLPTTRDVRTLGKYFASAADLLADRRYHLREETVPIEEMIEITLDPR